MNFEIFFPLTQEAQKLWNIFPAWRSFFQELRNLSTSSETCEEIRKCFRRRRRRTFPQAQKPFSWTEEPFIRNLRTFSQAQELFVTLYCEMKEPWVWGNFFFSGSEEIQKTQEAQEPFHQKLKLLFFFLLFMCLGTQGPYQEPRNVSEELRNLSLQ